MLRVEGLWDIINDMKITQELIKKPDPEVETPKKVVVVELTAPMPKPIPGHSKVQAKSDVLDKLLDELAKLESSLKNASANHDPDKPSPNYTHARNGIERIRKLLVKLAAAPDINVKINKRSCVSI